MTAKQDGEITTLARTPYLCPVCGCGTELCQEIAQDGRAWLSVSCENASLCDDAPCLLFLPQPLLRRATRREATAAWGELCAAIEQSRETARAALPAPCACVDGVCCHPIEAGGPPPGVRCRAFTVANLSEDER